MAKAKRKAAIPAETQAVVPQSQISAPKGFRVTRTITMPSLTMKEASGARILRFDSRMELSTYIDPDPKKAKEKPATVANVTDMESGEVFKFLCPSVVEANLRRDYDANIKISGEGKAAKVSEDDGEHTYVGRMFQIQCMGKRPNKRYRDFSIKEVEAE